MTRRTPLDSVHRDLGATLVDFAGFDMPIRYGNPVDEHHLVRSAVGLFDLSHMAEIDVVGAEAGAALDHALISRLSDLEVGQAKYTMMCDEAGGIVDDLIVYRLAGERYLVVANASNGAVVAALLDDRSSDFDATVVDSSADVALLAIQGPMAEQLATTVLGPAVADLKYYRCRELDAEGEEILVARTGYTGEDGFEIYVPAASAAPWWDKLMDVGAPHGIGPVGLAARDTLRLEAGMPLYGHELTRSTTPFDTRSGRLVDFQKPGNFVGRAALEVAQHEPHLSLVGLHVDGKRPAREGYMVFDESSSRSVGVLTSGTKSPTLDRMIAFGLLDRGVDVNQHLVVDVRGVSTPATVVPLPFYKRPKVTK